MEMEKGMKGLNNEQQYTNQSLNPILDSFLQRSCLKWRSTASCLSRIAII
jgi:hypothetical protein